MEETGDLEVGINSVQGWPHDANNFSAWWTEFEYGTRNWWATEFYLDSQWTQNESAVYTGFRIENRFRLLQGNHRITPILYVEYENLNAADKTILEVVGFDSREDHAIPNDIARHKQQHEIDTKLIAGSDFKHWNLSENFIAEKNLSNEPWEFGYAVGLSRQFPSLWAGLEFYGGLGDWHRFTVHDTSQYVGVDLAWKMRHGPRIRVSPTFGLTSQSHQFLLRFGLMGEFSHLDRRIRGLF